MLFFCKDGELFLLSLLSCNANIKKGLVSQKPDPFCNFRLLAGFWFLNPYFALCNTESLKIFLWNVAPLPLKIADFSHFKRTEKNKADPEIGKPSGVIDFGICL